ncbi:hypothetical protein ES703_90605 [subsurface metagenome]
MRSAKIVGVGSYAPPKVLTNKDLEKMVDTSNEWIIERTGIRERHIADDKTATSDIGLEAAKKALEDAKVNPEELDLIVVATVTPDFIFPATACLIQDRLGAKKAAAFDLEAACSGFIYGLSVARGFIASGPSKISLVKPIPRSSSALWNISFALGKLWYSSFPIPTSCEPCPGNRNANLTIL